MQLTTNKPMRVGQRGASLIEVLVAILLLSFGMLALGSMLAFSVQLPKLSGYRSVATNLASSHIEKIRANPLGFSSGSYSSALNESSGWSFTAITYSSGSDCSYPNCTSTTLATKDIQDTRIAVRRQLPGGDMRVTCSDSPCLSTSQGEIWIVWQEPSTSSVLDAGNSESCASAITSVYTDPKPRCLYVRFKIE